VTEPLIVLEGSPGYYSRFGIEYAVPFGITIELPDWAPPEAVQVLRLSRYDAGGARRSRVPTGVQHGRRVMRQNCRSAFGLCAQNARTERRPTGAVRRAITAHMRS
jgi:hypothetical protein